MASRLQRFWPILKAVLTVAILAAVGWQFVRILRAPELQGTDLSRTPTEILWDHIRHARPGWLVAAGVIYLLGLGFPAFYWTRLQRHFGQMLPGTAVVRAYYVSHLGKYLPGKAWALVLRATLLHGTGARLGLAGLAAFYEVLATMTGGVLFAALLFLLLMPAGSAAPDWATLRSLVRLQAEDTSSLDRKVLVLLALCLAVPLGVPILPPIFNRLLSRIAPRFRQGDAPPLPRFRFAYLGEGLALSCGTWLLFGASMGAVFQALLSRPPDWTLVLWGRYTAFFAVGYVASFLIFVVPGSLGVREYFLTLFLVPEVTGLEGGDAAQARVTVVAAVLVLRLIWTLAELLAAAVLYWLPGARILVRAPRTGGEAE
jgi:uncharacterized membrane protein YbhN (UPF0104 family)